MSESISAADDVASCAAPLPGLMEELLGIERDAAVLAGRRVRVLAAIHAAESEQRAAEVAAGQGPAGYESALDRERHWVSEEVGLILRVAGVTAQDQLLHAHQLVTRLSDTVSLLDSGELHPVQALRLSEAVIALTDEQCAAVQARVLARAFAQPHQSITGFTRYVHRAVLTAAPKTAEQAHLDALGESRVEIRPLEHGMAMLLAILAAADALRIKAAIDHRAKLRAQANATPMGEAGGLTVATRTDASAATTAAAPAIRVDGASADRRRAAALVELIDLGDAADPSDVPSRRGPVIQITVGIDSLAGVDDEPADLDGYGPVSAPLARRIAADPTSTWRRLITDRQGGLINCDRTRYKPPPDLDAFVRARDQTCTFPNCHRRAINCDLDHVQPWTDGGCTNSDNLVAVCPRHHHLKHDGGWTDDYDPATGKTTWRSPSGRTYVNSSTPLAGTHGVQPRP